MLHMIVSLAGMCRVASRARELPQRKGSGALRAACLSCSARRGSDMGSVHRRYLFHVGGWRAVVLGPSRSFAGGSRCRGQVTLCDTRLRDSVSVGVASSTGGTASTLRVLALGGEPLTAALAKRWSRRGAGAGETDREVTLLNLYGVTEACVYQTAGKVRGPEDITCGQACDCHISAG